jgi:hypothetical protein
MDNILSKEQLDRTTESLVHLIYIKAAIITALDNVAKIQINPHTTDLMADIGRCLAVLSNLLYDNTARGVDKIPQVEAKNIIE